MNEQDMATSFIEGIKDICFASIVIGVARAILVIAQDGQIIDTILNSLANLVSTLPNTIFATISLFIQAIIAFLVPSSSAHAALSMPLMAPLGDLVKVDRQVIVTTYQYGSGIGHMIFPTFGILMAALGIARVPYQKWIKAVWPLVLILTVTSIIFLIVGLNIYPVT